MIKRQSEYKEKGKKRKGKRKRRRGKEGGGEWGREGGERVGEGGRPWKVQCKVWAVLSVNWILIVFGVLCT